MARANALQVEVVSPESSSGTDQGPEIRRGLVVGRPVVDDVVLDERVSPVP